jgi:hypothetical protein
VAFHDHDPCVPLPPTFPPMLQYHTPKPKSTLSKSVSRNLKENVRNRFTTALTRPHSAALHDDRRRKQGKVPGSRTFERCSLIKEQEKNEITDRRQSSPSIAALLSRLTSIPLVYSLLPLSYEKCHF